MDWLINLTLIWVAIDLLTIGTAWYAMATIRRFWPEWWQQVVVVTVDSEFSL